MATKEELENSIALRRAEVQRLSEALKHEASAHETTRTSLRRMTENYQHANERAALCAEQQRDMMVVAAQQADEARQRMQRLTDRLNEEAKGRAYAERAPMTSLRGVGYIHAPAGGAT